MYEKKSTADRRQRHALRIFLTAGPRTAIVGIRRFLISRDTDHISDERARVGHVATGGRGRRVPGCPLRAGLCAAELSGAELCAAELSACRAVRGPGCPRTELSAGRAVRGPGRPRAGLSGAGHHVGPWGG
jgi:hypothetical protein